MDDNAAGGFGPAHHVKDGPVRLKIEVQVDLGAAQVLPEGTEVAPAATMVDGNISGLLTLAPLAKTLYPVDVETLRQDGRDDLVA